MNDESRNSYGLFDELIGTLRSEGYEDTAQRLHVILRQTAWTTGSELLGELGLEILAFQRVTRSVPTELQNLLGRCMKMVKKAWPLLYYKFHLVRILSALWSPHRRKT
ncbi:MAG: hypothetical protein AB1646_06705 [Thermodesulfobacteriota bacterium]